MSENSEGEHRRLPKPAEIVPNISDNLAAAVERSYLSRFSKQAAENEERYEHLKGLKDHYRHKKRWSLFIMVLMAAMVIFQSYLLIQVGRGVWDFSKYEWLLPALLVQNLAQVVGLAVFVVKALFRDIR